MTPAVEDDRRVVVIGTGPGGATAARFLARAGIEVTMLEAGPQRMARGLTVRVRGVTLVNLHRPLQQRRGDVTMTASPKTELYEDLAPGGLTNHWSCAVPRFSPEDFRDGERAGEEHTWPIRYEDLAPWYDEVEPLLHTAGSRANHPRFPAGRVHHEWNLAPDWAPIAAEARRLDREVLTLPYTYGHDTTITLSGTVFNAFVRVVQPVLREGRIAVRFDARVQRLEWSAEKGRVTAVIYKDSTGREERLPCRAVVVAANAINSARLLLQSTSATFPEGLGNTEGVLGRYLHDHPLAKLVVDISRPLSVHPPAYFLRPAIERTPPLYAAAAAQWTGTAIRAKSVLGGQPGRLPWLGFSVFGTMAPSRENAVTLDGSRTGPDGAAGINVSIRRPPESDVALERARDEVVELLSRANLQPRVRTWKVEEPGNSVHFAGTCRMHASPKFGMLNAVGRLHAVPNVMVADSSAFTTGPEKNPVLTAMALAARASDALARDLKSGAI